MEKIDLNYVTNPWQMVVAVVIVLAILVWPGVLAVLQNRRIEKTLTQNNGGSSLKDQLDRIEGTVTGLDKRVKKLEQHAPPTASTTATPPKRRLAGRASRQPKPEA